MPRAGLGFCLISLFFTTCVNLAASAPLPGRLSSSVERYHYGNDDVIPSLAIFHDRGIDVAAHPEYTKREYPQVIHGHEFYIKDDEYIKREYDNLSTLDDRDFDVIQYSRKRDVSDTPMLHRRSFWDKIRSGFQRAGDAIRNGFHKVQSGFQRAGAAIRNGFQRAGGAIKNGFRKVGQGLRNAGGAIRNGFQKAGGAMRSGFQKVGQAFRTAGTAMKKGFGIVGTAIKNNIGKVAKFGLKVLAAGASVVSKVIKFIPGIGTGISMALKGVAMGANIASEKIHANLGSQLDKAESGMDYIISPLGSVEKLAAGKGGPALAVAESLLTRFSREY